MRRKIICLSILFCFMTQMVFLSGCKDDNTDVVSSKGSSVSKVNSSLNASETDTEPKELTDEDIMMKYLKDELVAKHGLAQNTILTKSDEGVSGIVSAYIADINGDGLKDMLTTHSLGGDNAELKVDIYTLKDKKVSHSVCVIDGENEYANVYGNNDVFLKEKPEKGSYYICIKSYSTASFSGSTSEQYFTVYDYTKDGSIVKLKELRCSDENANALKIYIDNDVVFGCNALGIAESGYPYSDIDETAKALIASLTEYGLESKIYTEMSGSEIVAITFEGFKANSEGEVSVTYRNEAIADDFATLQIQLNDRTGLKDRLEQVQE